MNIFTLLETAISSDEIIIKEELTDHCLAYCTQNNTECAERFIPNVFEQPSYASLCQIVDPRELPPRKDFGTPSGLAALVHAIAHIEYSAIDLALDAVYRYTDVPKAYRVDWLEVAADEIRHFKMLENLLHDLGYHYGDFPVHSGLFDASIHTAGNIIDRMAVVPRYYEASGLDVNPQIIKKLENKRKNPEVKRLIDMLAVIYEEEIVHVSKGDKWFKYFCDRKNIDAQSHYIKILEMYHLNGKHRPHLNVEARKQAGFSCSELLKLGAKKCGE